MPVIMVQEVAADPNGLERFAAANQESVRAILEAAKKHGLIAPPPSPLPAADRANDEGG